MHPICGGSRESRLVHPPDSDKARLDHTIGEEARRLALPLLPAARR